MVHYFVRLNYYHPGSDANTLEVSAPGAKPIVDAIVFLTLILIDLVMLATYKLKTEVDRHSSLKLIS